MRTLSITLAAILVSSIACADDELADYEADNVALLIATDLSYRAMSDTVQLARGREPENLTEAPDGSWHRTLPGLDVAYRVSCLDTTLHPMEACDDSTASASVAVRETGTLDQPATRSTTARGDDWTIAAFSSDGATVTGRGWLEYDGGDRFAGIDSQFRIAYEAAYEDVAVGERPHGGAIDYAVVWAYTIDQQSRRFETHARVEFADDGSGTIVVAGRRYDDLIRP